MGTMLIFISKLFKNNFIKKIVYTAAVFTSLFLPLVPLVVIGLAIYKGAVFAGTVGGWQLLAGISYSFDGLAVIIIALGYFISIPAWIYSRSLPLNYELFDSIFFIQLAFLSATAITTDVFNIFVCLEVLGITSYVLVVFANKPSAWLASLSYLLVSATAMLLFLIGLYFLYNITGTLSLQEMGIRILLQSAYNLQILISAVLIISAIALRVAVVPVYGWLPDAHAMAIHPVSAVLSGILIKTPLFVLVRFVVIFPFSRIIGEAFAVAGALTALVGVLLALGQHDAKRLLAYSSVSQIGYIVCAWGLALKTGLETPLGKFYFTAAFMHALFHGMFKGLLFLAVGTVLDVSESRDVFMIKNSMVKLTKFGFPSIIVLLAYVSGALSITAVPPWNGFISKTLIVGSVKSGVLYWFLLLASVGTVASFIKLSRIFWMRDKKQSVEGASSVTQSSRKKQFIAFALVLGIFLCLVSGITGIWLYKLFYRFIALWIGDTAVYELSYRFYSLSVLSKTVLTLIAGAFVYLVLQIRRFRQVLEIIALRTRSFSGLFFAFFSAFTVLFVYVALNSISLNLPN